MRPPATPSYAPQTPTHHDPMATPRCCRPAFCDEPCRWPQPAADPAYSVPFDNSITSCLSLEHWDVEYGRGLSVAMAAAAVATILGGAMRGTPMRRQVGGLRAVHAVFGLDDRMEHGAEGSSQSQSTSPSCLLMRRA